MSVSPDNGHSASGVQHSTVTGRIAQWAIDLCYEDLPSDVVNATKRAILDCVGCALAGGGERVTAALIELGKQAGGEAESSVLGQPYRFSAQWTAFVNGAMAHAIDFDDTHVSVNGHPSASLVPAALALGEVENSSGREMITAYIAGIKVMGRLGQVVNLSHYDRGWHSSSTLGAIGSAVVGARMLRLNAMQLRYALGIAASFSSGLKKNFGTDTKPLQVGAASRNGVLAAQLAAAGVDADPNIFEGPMSFCSVAGELGRTLEASSLSDLGRAWQVTNPGLSFKRFPACYSNHRVVNAVLELVNRYDVQPEQVDLIDCATSYSAVEKLVYSRAQTPLEAKFSMHYCAAAALIDRRLGLPQFTEERVKREDVQALMSRVSVNVHPELQTAEQIIKCNFGEVTLHLKDGRSLTERVVYPLGNAKRPLSDADLDNKFLENAALILGKAGAEKSLRKLRSLEDINSIRDLLAELVTRR